MNGLAEKHLAHKLGVTAGSFKRDFLSTEIRKTHLNEWTPAAPERASRLRSNRPAEELRQGRRRAQRHPRRDQPSDPRARRGSRGPAVPPAQPLDRADRVRSRAAARVV